MRGAGYQWESYGAEQAGEVFGRLLIPMILVLMLVFVARRS